jgi:hypothetical protein
MATTIKIKNSVTAAGTPSSLAQGELAVNITDKKVWVGNAATTPILLVGGGSDGSFANLAYTGTLTGGTGIVNLGSGQIYKDASGNVGIGTTPSVKLDVRQSTASDLQLQLYNNNAGVYASSIKLNADNATGSYYNAIQSYNGSNAQWQISGGGSNSTLVFSTGSSFTERVRIGSTGAVTIRNSVTSNNALELGNTNTTAGTSYGVKFAGGTNSSDYCISGDNAAGTVNLFNFRGNGDLQFNSGYGSAATAYGCRAWVNYNGTGASIRGSGNVSSVTNNGTGDNTINFTNAMPDANFSWAVTQQLNGTGNADTGASSTARTQGTGAWGTGFVRILTMSNSNLSQENPLVLSVQIFR